MREFFDNSISSDFFHLFAGGLIGRGQGREVYEHAFDPKLVIKIETGSGSFQNVMEWETWRDAAEMQNGASNWLAPCEAISPCGIVLVQRKTKPAKVYPDKVPCFLTDLKRGNFGMIGNRFVAHDYGVNLMCNEGLKLKMQKAEWWDE